MPVQQQNKIDNLLNYLASRGIGADWYDFMYSTDKFWDVNKRLLIPFYWKGDIVGFTGRIFEKLEKFSFTKSKTTGIGLNALDIIVPVSNFFSSKIFFCIISVFRFNFVETFLRKWLLW